MKSILHRIILVLCLTGTLFWSYGQADTLRVVEVPTPPAITLDDYTLATRGQELVFQAPGLNGVDTIILNGEKQALVFANGRAALPLAGDQAGQLHLVKAGPRYHLYHASRYADGTARIRHLPLWLSLLPPLVAIGLALVFKEVVISLFLGIWTGAFIAGGLRIDSLYYFVLSFFRVVQEYVITALNDSGHLSIILFSMLIGGMVAIISRNGGMAGVVQGLSRYARSDRSAQAITWLLGVAIFFDDYANTLIVGNTMRPVTDRFRISREKLAYIVDSTAAPVAAVAFVTTWIGAELGYIGDGIAQLPNWSAELTPYAIFIESLKYSYYPVLTLLFILFLVWQKRDYGPMHRAEVRARSTGVVAPSRSGGEDDLPTEDLSPVAGAPLRAYNAVIPVAVVILMTLFGLLDTGFAALYSTMAEAGQAPATSGWGDVWSNIAVLYTNGESPTALMKLGRIIGASDSYVALLWASLSGVIVALLLTLVSRIMSLERSINTLLDGFKTMLPALLILTLAWSLAATTEQLHTATFLTESLRGNLPAVALPPILFLLSALISFSTGSSWSTMAILYPIAIPLTWAIAQSSSIDYAHSLELLFNVISIVLSASVLGDHCSPISDTTILSSLASDCNHIDHVRTQMPYALSVGVVSITLGFLSTLLGGGWGVCFVLLMVGIATIFGIVRLLGKPVAEYGGD